MDEYEYIVGDYGYPVYSAEARKVGSGIRSGRGKVEYGPHIPTLVKQVESGELD